MVETDPMRQALFAAQSDGYYHHRIPGLAVSPGGVVLAYCEARLGQGDDWAPIDIRLRRSLDGGCSWEPARTLVDHLQWGGGGTVNNCVAIADRLRGRTHLLFCHDYRRAFTMVSDDDGVTFGEPREITAAFEGFRRAYDWGILAIGPGHGIQLDRGPHAGRLTVPVWISSSRSREHRPNRCGTLYSDDGGVNWQVGQLVPRATFFMNEAALAQRGDGSLLINIRPGPRVRRRLQSISSDGGLTWSEPQLVADLREPTCFAAMVRYDEKTLLFANPDNDQEQDEDPRAWTFCERRNLTVKVSTDGGRSWPVSRILEAGPSGYADLAVTDSGAILCLYEDGRFAAPRPGVRALTLARFRLPWILGTEPTGDDP